MKLRRLPAALALTVMMASLALGCAGSTDDSEEDVGSESGEDALTQRQLPGVVAMKFESPGRAITIGAPAKVAKAMKALARPGGPSPRCSRGPSTKITFFDKDAKTIATGSVFCFLGTVTLTNGSTIRFQTRPGGLDVLDEPLVPADALWGITKIDIERRSFTGGPNARLAVTQPAAISTVLGAYDIGQTIDLGYSGTRCPPTHMLTFRRADNEVARSSYVCGSSGGDVPASVTAMFTIVGSPEAEPLARGGVKIDPRPIAQLFAAQR